jgi:carboxyl-terminal processing protease
MKINALLIRYTVGVAAMVSGVVLSISGSDRGALFHAPTTGTAAFAQETPPDYDLPALTIFNRVVLQMRDSYVEPARIDASRMLVYALNQVQSTVPEVVTLFNVDLDSAPTQVEVRVGAERQTFELPPMNSVFEMTFRLRDIFRFMEEHLDSSTTDLRDIEYAAVNGMLQTLDPHTGLLTPEIFEEMRTSNRGSFGGLGIVISIRDGQLTIMSPIPDTPASNADLRSGDRIVKIDDESTINMPLEEAVSRLRGDVGTTVTLEVMRQGWSEPHEFTLRRQIIEIDSVKHEDLGDGIGYVRITDFQDNTYTDLRAALAELTARPEGLRGLVLDLRDNPGGLLQQAIRVSDAFLESGTIVTTVMGEHGREDSVAAVRDTEPHYPIVVLVNQGSASASEIVAGALKNHNRALIVGDRTFGKGSVQHIYDFIDGSALKMTVAQYLTPGDISIQGVGIVPDIQVFASSANDEYIDLYPNAQNRMSESNYERSLTSDRVSADEETPEAVVSYFYEPEETDPDAIEDPDAFRMDFEIGFARQLVMQADETWERTAMMSEVAPAIERIRTEQLNLLRERMQTQNIDWSQGETVIQPVTVTATTDHEDHELIAGEPVEVTVTLTNHGSRAMHQLRAVSSSSYYLFDDREFVFGVVEPGQTASWTVKLEVPVEDPTRVESVKFHIFADTIALEESCEMMVHVQGRERPHFGMTYLVDDSAGGNGDGQLQVGETIRFVLDVMNVGGGDAGESVFMLRNRSDNALFLRSGRTNVDALAAGAHQRSEFEFTIQSAPADNVVALNAEVFDTVFQEYLVEELRIPLASADMPAPVAGEGLVEVLVNTALRGSTFDSAPRRLDVPAGTVLRSDRTVGNWVHVRWAGEEGWLSSSEIRTASGEPSDIPAPAPMPSLQPPQIDVRSTEHETHEEVYVVQALVSDDESVLDYYVIVDSLVSPRRTRSLKRAYEYVGQAEAQLEQSLPLQPGMNRITIVARDSNRATSAEVLFVYRHP